LRAQFRRGFSEHGRWEILDVGADVTATHLAQHGSAKEREGATDGCDESACRSFGLLIGEDVLDVRVRGGRKIAVSARAAAATRGGE
jgi:hypothetical protein